MTTEDALPVVGYASRDGSIWRKRSSIFTPDALVRRRDALAALTLAQAERDAMQQERDELRAECDGLFVALAELVSAEQTPMPPAAAGVDVQTAWAERRAAARDNASRALTPKATQQETRA